MHIRVVGLVVVVIVSVLGFGAVAALDDSRTPEGAELDQQVSGAGGGLTQVETSTASSTPTPSAAPETETPTPTSTGAPVTQTTTRTPSAGPTPTPSAGPVTETPTPTPSAAPVTETPTPTPIDAPVTETPTPTPVENDTSPGDPVSEPGKGYPQSSTDSEVVEYQRGYQCLENPWRVEDEDDYTYDEYGMWIPDRFVEDLLETDGVASVSSGIEGAEVDAGALVHVTTQTGAEPMLYCDADDVESVIYPDYYWDGTYTPTTSIAWANPTHQKQMLVSDQSVEWLLSQDRVAAVETARIESNGGTETQITVVVTDDDSDPRDALPDTIDGYDVTYSPATASN